MSVIDGERQPPRLLAVRGAACRPPLRRRSPPACRCRPGDVATWVRLEFSAGQAHDLRDAAGGAGVSVDAWLGVMIEYCAALRILEDVLGSCDQARQRLLQVLERGPVMVAALPGWRRWQGYLGRRTVGRRDELPEVVLPERLIARGDGDVDVAGALSAAPDWPLARCCEIAACGLGRTLEAFMLQAALE